MLVNQNRSEFKRNQQKIRLKLSLIYLLLIIMFIVLLAFF